MTAVVVRFTTRVVGLALVVGTVLYLVDGLREPASLARFEKALDGVFDWLRGVFERVAAMELRMGEVGLDELGSPRDWLEAVRGIFGGEPATSTVPNSGITVDEPSG